jgi:hypothetical protein
MIRIGDDTISDGRVRHTADGIDSTRFWHLKTQVPVRMPAYAPKWYRLSVSRELSGQRSTDHPWSFSGRRPSSASASRADRRPDALETH